MSDTDQTLPEGVTGNFVRPCLECGATVHVVDTGAQPHDCRPPASGAELVARAWWAGYDAANERRRLDLGAIRDLTVADRPYDWRLAQIDEIAREAAERSPGGSLAEGQLRVIADHSGAVLTHHDRALPPVFRTRYEAETFLRYWRRNTARFGPVGDPAVVDAVVAEFHRLMRATPGAEREWVRP